MKCRSCGSDTSADFAFCPKCGSRLDAACPFCGFACPVDFAFCPKCGSPLTAGPSPGERRTQASGECSAAPAIEDTGPRTTPREGAAGERRPVTVLFADLSGFTKLAETRDPEEVATLIDRCLGAMAEVIYRYEGTVDKYMGDCVMALFGAPIAHEDDPERAISAALSMRDEVAALSQELEAGVRTTAAPEEPLLTLHVGINTGMVVAGAVGNDRRREYTVLGDSVNVAARLGAAARRGEVIVGDSTYRLARHAFTFEPLGALSLKGRAEPMLAHRVLRNHARPRSGRGLESHGLTTPLIGRDEALQQLRATFDRMLQRQTQVVSIIGEAGVGKSRLMNELFERLEDDGWLERERVAVRRAACSSLGEQTYGVLAALLRDAYRVASDDQPELAQQKLVSGLEALGADAEGIYRMSSLLAHVLGASHSDPLLRFLDPEQLRRQLLLAVQDVIDLRTRQGPLILVVEDAHWSDAASIDLLRFIVDRLSGRRLLLLLAHRPTFDAGRLVSARSGFTAIKLTPLTTDDSEALLGAVFGASLVRIPTQIRRLIVARAGGNPLFLEEIVRSLIEAGALVRETDGWASTEKAELLDVPLTVQALLLARLDRLPAGARRFAQEAAVLGPTFATSLLRAVCSAPELMADHIDTLQDANVVEMEDRPAELSSARDQRLRFTHALLQETAYQSLLIRRRSELHHTAALALERIREGAPERLEDLEALGHHYGLSPEPLKGAQYLIAAGDWARAMFANEDAARHYQRAIGVLRADAMSAKLPEWRDARERLGNVLASLGRRDEAFACYEEILASLDEEPDPLVRARTERQIGGLHREAGDRDRAMVHYLAALRTLDGEAEHIELASVYQELGRLAFRAGDNAEAIRLAEQSLAIAERLMVASPSAGDAAAAVAQAHNTIGIAMARGGAMQEAVKHLEFSLSVAHEHELLDVACRAYSNLGALYCTVDPARAIASSMAGLELAKRIGDLGLQAWLYANLAGAYCTFTDQCDEQGIGAAQAAIELDRRLGQLDHLAVPLIVLGQIYQCHGNAELARQHYQEALDLAEGMGEPQLLFPCYDGLATLFLEIDDDAQAERYLLKGQQVCEQAGLDADSLMVLPFLG